MARKTKVGLEYFPLDVDFHNDSKIQLITAEFGSHSESIIIRLLCKIYRNGYFLEYNNDEALLIATSVGFSCSGGLVNEVVKGLVRRSFFNEGVFNQFGVLTSKGIQKRFLEATERRQKVIMLQEYLLMQHDVDILNKNVTIIDLNGVISTQRKGKERKGEEITDSQYFLIDDFLKKALADEMYFVTALIQEQGHNGLTKKTLHDWMLRFNTELKSEGDIHKSEPDYRRHFKNWLRKKLEKKTQQQSTNSGIRTERL